MKALIYLSMAGLILASCKSEKRVEVGVPVINPVETNNIKHEKNKNIH